MSAGRPDRGYSWIIAISCAFIHFAIFGVFRSWSVIYVAVLKEYGVTREEASWPSSVCSSVLELIGPAVSILTHYTSKRAACMLGCAVAAFGLAGCYFAANVMWITVFYGVVHGIGCGFVLTLTPVFINEYFKNLRTSAMGIAVSGVSIGSFVVPIAMEWLLENYGLRGSFLLVSGLVLNTLVASALLKPPCWLEIKSNKALIGDTKDQDSAFATNEKKDSLSLVIRLEHENCIDSASHSNDTVSDDNGTTTLTKSDVESSKAVEGTTEKEETIASSNESSDSNIHRTRSTNSTRLNKNDVCDKTDYEVQTPLVDSQFVQEKSKNKLERLKKPMNSIMDILKKPMFHVIAYSMFIYFIAIQSYFVSIVDYAKDKGIPEADGVYIVTIFSLTELVGSLCLGWVTDRNYVKRKNMLTFDLMAISVIMHLYPLVDYFPGLLAVAAFHGVTAGSCVTLFYVLQAEYLGVKRLTLVVGLTNFITGAITLLRPAMVGVFRDTIGSYDWMFHSFGFVFLAFSILWLAEPWMTGNRVRLDVNFQEKT